MVQRTVCCVNDGMNNKIDEYMLLLELIPECFLQLFENPQNAKNFYFKKSANFNDPMTNFE